MCVCVCVLFEHVPLKTTEYFLFYDYYLYNMKIKKTFQINIKPHNNNNETELRGTTSEMLESAWARMEHFLHHLVLDIRKIIRLECLHLKIVKRK